MTVPSSTNEGLHSARPSSSRQGGAVPPHTVATAETGMNRRGQIRLVLVMELWMVVAGGLGLVIGVTHVLAPDNPLIRAILRPEADEWGAEWGSQQRLDRVRSAGWGFAIGGLLLLAVGFVL